MPGRKKNLYLFGTVQLPAPPGAPAHKTTLLTDDEKRTLVDGLASRELAEMPLVIEHTGGERPGVGASANRIGRVMHGMVDKYGRLMAVAELYWDAPETEVVLARLAKGERLGFSLGTVYQKLGETSVINKRVDHLGLTDNPAYAGETSADGKTSDGTWLHVGSTTPDGLVQQMQKFLAEDGMYVPASVRSMYATPAMPAAESKIGAYSEALVAVGASRHLLQPNSMADANINTPAPTGLPAAQPVVTQPAAAPVVPQPVAPAVSVIPQPSPEALQQAFRAELAVLNAEVAKKYTTRPTDLTEGDLNEARATLRRYALAFERAGINPVEASPLLKTQMRILEDYVAVYSDSVEKSINKMYPMPEDRARAFTMLDQTSNPMHRDFMHAVVANASSVYNSQVAEEARLRKANADLEAKTASDAREAELKKLRDEHAMVLDNANKRARETEDKLTQLQQVKRARVDEFPASTAPLPAAAVTGAPVPGEIVAVGASAGAGGAWWAQAPTDRVRNVDSQFFRSIATTFAPPKWADKGFYSPKSLPPTDQTRQSMEYSNSRLEEKLGVVHFDNDAATGAWIRSYEQSLAQ